MAFWVTAWSGAIDSVLLDRSLQAWAHEYVHHQSDLLFLRTHILVAIGSSARLLCLIHHQGLAC